MRKRKVFANATTPTITPVHELRPSDFIRIRPFESVFGNGESEIVARNILVIMSKGANVFRSLSWEEYKAARLIDGSFTDREEHHFFRVYPYCVSAEKARTFSKHWAI